MAMKPIEHWVSNWEGKKGSEPRKKVTSCTACVTGTSYFKGGLEVYLCHDCLVRWFPNKSEAEMAELLVRQGNDLKRIEAHERYRRAKKCQRCGNVVNKRDPNSLAICRFCGDCFDMAVKLKAEAPVEPQEG